MPDQPTPTHTDEGGFAAFDALMTSSAPAATGFATVFRGYDREEVDRALARLQEQLGTESDSARAAAADAVSARRQVERLEGDLTALRAQLAEAEGRIATLS